MPVPWGAADGHEDGLVALVLEIWSVKSLPSALPVLEAGAHGFDHADFALEDLARGRR